MGEVQPFDFHGRNVRVLTDGQDEPWFIAKDICDVLGLDNVTNALRALDDDEKSNFTNCNVAQNGGRAPLIVSESGFYKLVLRSRKPVAKEFQRWVTHDVLPSIRKHGAYMTEQTVEQILSNPDTLIRLATDLKREREARKQAEQQVQVLEPKDQALETFTSVEGSRSINDAAKILTNHGVRVTGKRLRGWMAEHGWIFRREGHWVAYAHAIHAGLLKMREYETSGVHTNGERFAFAPQVRITRKGLEALHRKLFTFEDSLFDDVEVFEGEEGLA